MVIASLCCDWDGCNCTLCISQYIGVRQFRGNSSPKSTTKSFPAKTTLETSSNNASSKWDLDKKRHYSPPLISNSIVPNHEKCWLDRIWNGNEIEKYKYKTGEKRDTSLWYNAPLSSWHVTRMNFSCIEVAKGSNGIIPKTIKMAPRFSWS